MRNCLVLQEKVVRVMKPDGKILEYKPPIRVHQVLSEFSHHVISDELPMVKHMHPNAEMIRGHLYYLLPLPVATPPIKKMKAKAKMKKVVRFSDEVLEDGSRATGVVRIKVMISKKELQRMLTEEEVSVDDHGMHKSTNKAADTYDRDGVISKGWSPTMECIPEIN